MKKFNKMIEEKRKETVSKRESVKVSETISKNTRGTQLVKLNLQIQTLDLIKELLNKLNDDVKLSDESLNTINRLITLSSERNLMSVECKENDSILELMSKYSDVKDLLTKLTKYCEKNNLQLDFKSNKVIAKKVDK